MSFSCSEAMPKNACLSVNLGIAATVKAFVPIALASRNPVALTRLSIPVIAFVSARRQSIEHFSGVIERPAGF